MEVKKIIKSFIFGLLGCSVLFGICSLIKSSLNKETERNV